MTTITLDLAPNDYEMVEVWNDIVFQGRNAAIQTEGHTGNHWDIVLRYINLTLAEQRDFDGQLAAVRGVRNRLKVVLSDIGYSPRGSAGGTPLLNGAHSVGATVISVKGMPTSMTNVLRSGDWITVGNELKQTSGALNADASGEGSVGIWPELHQAYSDGAAIEYVAPFGVFLQTTASPRPYPNDSERASRTITLKEDVLA